jgi:hypothetical protein
MVHKFHLQILSWSLYVIGNIYSFIKPFSLKKQFSQILAMGGKSYGIKACATIHSLSGTPFCMDSCDSSRFP